MRLHILSESYNVERYEYSENPIQQVADFYALMAMLGDAEEHKVKDFFIEDLQYIKKIMLPAMAGDYIKKLKKSIALELRHFPNYIDFYKTYDSYLDKARNAGIESVSKGDLYKYHEDLVKEVSNIKDIVERGIKAFSLFVWLDQYGGKSWYQICLWTKRLIENRNNLGQLPFIIDHIVDLVHNTGHVFQYKIEGYDNFDFHEFLNMKAEKHPLAYSDKCSNIIRKMLHHLYRKDDLAHRGKYLAELERRADELTAEEIRTLWKSSSGLVIKDIEDIVRNPNLPEDIAEAIVLKYPAKKNILIGLINNKATSRKILMIILYELYRGILKVNDIINILVHEFMLREEITKSDIEKFTNKLEEAGKLEILDKMFKTSPKWPAKFLPWSGTEIYIDRKEEAHNYLSNFFGLVDTLNNGFLLRKEYFNKIYARSNKNADKMKDIAESVGYIATKLSFNPFVVDINEAVVALLPKDYELWQAYANTLNMRELGIKRSHTARIRESPSMTEITFIEWQDKDIRALKNIVRPPFELYELEDKYIVRLNVNEAKRIIERKGGSTYD